MIFERRWLVEGLVHCVCLVLVVALVVLRRVLYVLSLVSLLGVLVLDVEVVVSFRIEPSTLRIVPASVGLST